MAKSALKTTRKKSKTPRSPKFVDTKYLGFEPEWEGADTWDAEQLRKQKAYGYNWYNYFHDISDLKKNLHEWMQKEKYSAADIKAVKACPDAKLSTATVALATMLLQGMPNSEADWLRNRISSLIEHGKTIKAVKKKVEKKKGYQPTIQDRMREQLSNIIAEMEDWDDNVQTDPKYVAPDAVAWLKSNEIAQAHINKIIEYYEPKLAEIKLLNDKNADEDLKEGYSHFKKADIKRVITFYENLLEGLKAYHKFKQVNRKTRTKKAPSAQKLVAKVKYQKEDKDLKLVSIKPSDIVGATALWVYNSKTRKLGIYKADPTAAQLSVKGTTIVGFDEKNSVAKTLRKPADQLKEFGKAGKVKLRTFLDEIKAVDIKLTGRINADTILLKAY